MQSNCETILYYEVYYCKSGFEKDCKNTPVESSEHAKNISSDISFDTEYLVRVVAHNNYPYESSSDMIIVTTPPRRKLIPIFGFYY